MVEAHWSGSWPALCCGEWSLKVNGKDVTDKIPENLRNQDMNTYGTYQRWYFDDNWIEQYEDYESGQEYDEWIESNKYWLDTITTDYKTQHEIYEAINAEDFRHSSCGGCI